MSKEQILWEGAPELVESLANDGDEKHYYIRGKFATIGHRNANRRVYPRELWEREVARYQDEIAKGSIKTLMEWGHPKGRLEVDPIQAVAKITKLFIEGEYVMGEAVILDGPVSDTIKSLIKNGVQISVSSRGSGNTDSTGLVTKFNLITFDLVATPSDGAATMYGIYENLNPVEEEDMSESKELITGLTESVEKVANRISEIETRLNESAVTRDDVAKLTLAIREKNSHINDLMEENAQLRERVNSLISAGVIMEASMGLDEQQKDLFNSLTKHIQLTEGQVDEFIEAVYGVREKMLSMMEAEFKPRTDNEGKDPVEGDKGLDGSRDVEGVVKDIKDDIEDDEKEAEKNTPSAKPMTESKEEQFKRIADEISEQFEEEYRDDFLLLSRNLVESFEQREVDEFVRLMEEHAASFERRIEISKAQERLEEAGEERLSNEAISSLMEESNFVAFSEKLESLVEMALNESSSEEPEAALNEEKQPEKKVRKSLADLIPKHLL